MHQIVPQNFHQVSSALVNGSMGVESALDPNLMQLAGTGGMTHAAFHSYLQSPCHNALTAMQFDPRQCQPAAEAPSAQALGLFSHLLPDPDGLGQLQNFQANSDVNNRSLRSGRGNCSSGSKQGGNGQVGASYASRHQQAEARRRLRINERLEALRSVVPHSERANTASFLEEVFKYVEKLKLRVVELEAKLGVAASAVEQGGLPGSAAPAAAGQLACKPTNGAGTASNNLGAGAREEYRPQAPLGEGKKEQPVPSGTRSRRSRRSVPDSSGGAGGAPSATTAQTGPSNTTRSVSTSDRDLLRGTRPLQASKAAQHAQQGQERSMRSSATATEAAGGKDLPSISEELAMAAALQSPARHGSKAAAAMMGESTPRTPTTDAMDALAQLARQATAQQQQQQQLHDLPGQHVQRGLGPTVGAWAGGAGDPGLLSLVGGSRLGGGAGGMDHASHALLGSMALDPSPFLFAGHLQQQQPHASSLLPPPPQHLGGGYLLSPPWQPPFCGPKGGSDPGALPPELLHSVAEGGSGGSAPSRTLAGFPAASRGPGSGFGGDLPLDPGAQLQYHLLAAQQAAERVALGRLAHGAAPPPGHHHQHQQQVMVDYAASLVQGPPPRGAEFRGGDDQGAARGAEPPSLPPTVQHSRGGAGGGVGEGGVWGAQLRHTSLPPLAPKAVEVGGEDAAPGPQRAAVTAPPAASAGVQKRALGALASPPGEGKRRKLPPRPAASL